MNITATLHSTAFHQPEHPALIDDGGTISYAELSAAVRHCAGQLKQYGIAPGMGVGVMGANSRGFIIMVYAVMECGAVVMPVQAQISADELRELVTTSGFHAMLHDGAGPVPECSRKERIETERQDWTLFFLKNAQLPETVAPLPEHSALVRFTSGTTGASKGVLLSHEAIEARTRVANDALQLGPDDVVIWVLPMAFHFVVSIILYLRYGCSVVICNSFHAAGILDAINRHHGTFLYASPMHIRLLASDPSSTMAPTLKRVISTSTGITREQCASFTKRYAIAVSQAYGIIEAGLPVINLRSAETNPGAIGHAIKAFSVEVVDDRGGMAKPGIPGNLVLRGPGMFEAYLFPFRTRNEVMVDGWFHTGDLAVKDENGLITLIGRKKSMINVAGNKVFPEEVESVLNRHSAITASRVSGFQHPLLGECVQAEVMLRPGAEKPDTESLRRFCHEHLSPYKVPQRIEWVNELPVTGSGKIKRG